MNRTRRDHWKMKTKESSLTNLSRKSKEKEDTPSQCRKTTAYFTLSKDGCGNAYVPHCLPRFPKRMRGIMVRNSDRWADTSKIPHGVYNVPFIDNLGRYTGSTLYKWFCEPSQLVATTVATIARRLSNYCLRHNKRHIVLRNMPRILRASAYYAMSKNSWFWDRILFFSRNLEKHGNRILHWTIKFVNKGDDNKRFVYGQVSSQTNWLLFRAAKPRDKSLYISKGTEWVSRVTGRSIPPADRKYLMGEFAKTISSI